MKNKTTIFLLVFFMALSTAFLAYYYFAYQHAPKRLPIYGNPGHHVEQFSFTDQDGKTITEKDMDGKIYVTEFFFSTCEGICPKMNENMTLIAQEFRGQNDIAILSHTVKPEEDSVARLKEYSLKFDTDPNQWHFLTGPRDDLYKMAINSYLVPVDIDSSDKNKLPEFIHSERFVLVDKEKQVRGAYDGTKVADVKRLIEDIKELRKEYN